MIRLTVGLLMIAACVWLVLTIATFFVQDEIDDTLAPNFQEIIALSQKVKAGEDHLRLVREGFDKHRERIGDKVSVINIIDLIAENVPTGITLGTMRVSKGGISIKGIARDRGVVSEMVHKMAVSLKGPSVIIEKLSDMTVDRNIYQEFLVSQGSHK